MVVLVKNSIVGPYKGTLRRWWGLVRLTVVVVVGSLIQGRDPTGDDRDFRPTKTKGTRRLTWEGIGKDNGKRTLTQKEPRALVDSHRVSGHRIDGVPLLPLKDLSWILSVSGVSLYTWSVLITIFQNLSVFQIGSLPSYKVEIFR